MSSTSSQDGFFTERYFIDHYLFRRLDQRYGHPDGSVDQKGLMVETGILRRHLDKTAEYGMTSYVIFSRDFERLLTYDFAGCDVIPEDSPHRKKATIYRQALKEVLQHGKSLGLKMIFHTNQLEFPDEIYARFGKEMAGTVKACPGKERTWELYRGKMREFWERFPECDGLQLTTSETQVAVSRCACESCRNIPTPERFARLTMETAAVCRERGKTMVLRTWGDMDNPELYNKSVSRLPQDVVISIKHTAGDFHIHHSVTPNLGIGSHVQTVEFDCWREYTGWNQLPCYMGDVFAERMKACAEKGIRSVGARINWDPGVNGIFDVPWGNEVNVFLFARLARNPYQDPDSLLDEWILTCYPIEALTAARHFYKLSYETQKQFLYVLGHPWQDHSRVIRVFAAQNYRDRAERHMSREMLAEVLKNYTPEYMDQRRHDIDKSAVQMAEAIEELRPYVPLDWYQDMRRNLENERLIAQTMAWCLEFYVWMVRADRGEKPAHLKRMETGLHETLEIWQRHDASNYELMCGANALGMLDELKALL